MSTAYLAAQVPSEMAASLKRLAERNERSVSAEIRRAIEAHLERETKEQLLASAA